MILVFLLMASLYGSQKENLETLMPSAGLKLVLYKGHCCIHFPCLWGLDGVTFEFSVIPMFFHYSQLELSEAHCG